MIYPHSRQQKLAMLGVTLLIFTSLIFTSVASAQAKFGVLHTFGAAGDGNSPWAQMLEDKSGNLYGTTIYGGSEGYGSVYELSQSSGKWTETVLYSFQGTANDRQGPISALLMDHAGNLYGSTFWGGQKQNGTIFELSSSNGVWAESSVFAMPAPSNPAGLLMGTDGWLYGTAVYGEFAYRVHPPTEAGGKWGFEYLFTFNGGTDGEEPLYQGGALIADKSGNLYGTTIVGGAYGDGEVFELSPPAAQGDSWTETVLYSFGSKNGDAGGPPGAVVMDAAGNLYGTAGGGKYDLGTVWELSPPITQGQPWTETILHDFAGGADDGSAPYAGPVMDKAGNLYGVTYTGGNGNCSFNYPGCGVVFELSPAGDGTWTETLLHIFTGEDGEFPYGGLMIGGNGTLFGTTSAGGRHNAGTAFEIQP
jgi:uncharacterized repeat protein (TIGR03803 family)